MQSLQLQSTSLSQMSRAHTHAQFSNPSLSKFSHRNYSKNEKCERFIHSRCEIWVFNLRNWNMPKVFECSQPVNLKYIQLLNTCVSNRLNDFTLELRQLHTVIRAWSKNDWIQWANKKFYVKSSEIAVVNEPLFACSKKRSGWQNYVH